MSTIETVVRVATTPDQAKVFVAMLQAAGIPARVEGDSLADEYAVARRLMNLMGTKVMVPTASLEEACAVLEPVAIDAAELTSQALAAPLETPPAAPVHWHEPAAKVSRWLVRVVVALFALGIVWSIAEMSR